MSSTMTKILPLLAVTALLTTGCGVQAQEYDDVRELAAAWEDYSGHSCDGAPYDGGVTCTDEVVLNVFQKSDALDEHIAFLEEFWTEDSHENSMLVGPNWNGYIPDGELDDLAAEIGGEIITVGSA